MKMLFEGVAVAIITPFKCGNVDYSAFQKLIEKQIYEGAKAIVVLGTTGESATISPIERVKIIKCAKKTISGRCKLIIGTGSNNFEKACGYTVMAEKLGADGALVVTPYYNKTTQAGLVEYYSRLANIGLPIIMYNVPSRTGLNMSVETVEKLALNPMIVGLKESTSDISRIIELSKACRNKMALYSGEDALNYVFYSLGANGAISVAANAYCDKVQRVYDLANQGLMTDARAVQESLDGINKALFMETNPIPIKYLLSKMGYCENEVRMPLVKLSTNSQQVVDEEMAELQ